MCRISGPSTPVHTPVHTIRSCIHVFTPASSFYLGWICLHCLPVSIPIYPVDTCSPLFILPTPVHTCPYLSCLTIIHALYRRSHLPLLALRPCPYILTFLFLCSGPGQRELGCSEVEGAPDRGLCPALTVLPATQGAAHGVGAGASRGGCVTGGVWGGSGSWPPLALGSQGPRPPLLPPVFVQEDAASPLAVLEELTSGDCRQELATKLVKLFLGQGLTGPFLDYLTRREVARTSELPA